MQPRHSRQGFTLVELMVTLAVLAISVGVATAAILSDAGAGGEDMWSRQLREGRSRAVRDGERVVVWPDSAHLRDPVLFLPDGRVVAEEGR